MPYRKSPFTLFILFTLILVTTRHKIFANSNPNLLPGYYIANNGDSISCLIEYKDWYFNPQSIEVIVNNEKRMLGTSDIKGFGAFGYDDYKAAAIRYHLNPINGTELPERFSDSILSKSIFLKVLIKGPYSLYEMEVPARKYFFIQKGNGPVAELLYRVAAQAGEIKEDKQYANTLAGLFQDEGVLDRYKDRVYGASYNSDIISLVKTLDEKLTGNKSKKVESARLQMDLFAGDFLTFFPSSGLHGQFPAYGKMAASNSLSGGVDLLFITPQRFKAFKLGLSLGYVHYTSTGTKTDSTGDRADLNNYRVTTYTEKLSLNNTMIMANLHASYDLNPSDKIKFYLKAGFSVGFGKKDVYLMGNANYSTMGFNSGNIINTSGEITEKIVPLSKVVFNPNLGAGIATGRHRLEFSYYFPLNTSTDENNVFKIGMAGVVYYFTVLK